MDGPALVAAMAFGDPVGVGGAYRAYADRIYTYCRGSLVDPDTAAEAVRDTFVVAGQRAGELRDPQMLRPWLYAIARHECLRRSRGRHARRAVTAGLTLGGPSGVAELRPDDIRQLVWAAAGGLDQADRLVFELSTRHELPTAELGAALGASADHVQEHMSRVRSALERALGALLAAGAQECATLTRALRGWDGAFTPSVRKRIVRHTDACATCTARQDDLRPAELLSAYAGLPFLVAPAEVRWRLQVTGSGAVQEATRIRIGRRAGRFHPDTGFPPTYHQQRQQRQRLLAGAGGLLAVLLVAVGGATVPFALSAGGAEPLPAGQEGLAAGPAPWSSDSPSPGPAPATPLVGIPPWPSGVELTPSAADPSRSPSTTGMGSSGEFPALPPNAPPPPGAAPVAASPPPAAAQAFEASPAAAEPGTSPPAAAAPDGEPPTSIEPVPPQSVTYQVTARMRCPTAGGVLTVTARVSDGTINSADLHWSAGSASGRTQMKPGGDTAEAAVEKLPARQVTWHVTITLPDGRAASTDPRVTSCPGG